MTRDDPECVDCTRRMFEPAPQIAAINGGKIDVELFHALRIAMSGLEAVMWRTSYLADEGVGNVAVLEKWTKWAEEALMSLHIGAEELVETSGD